MLPGHGSICIPGTWLVPQVARPVVCCYDVDLGLASLLKAVSAELPVNALLPVCQCAFTSTIVQEKKMTPGKMTEVTEESGTYTDTFNKVYCVRTCGCGASDLLAHVVSELNV